jgi:ribose 5-phosphate isomerase A
MSSAERLERIGERAASEISEGALVGLGSGSTAEAMVWALGKRVAAGLRMTGVATSSRTAELASSLAIPLRQLSEIDSLDLCIDGADEIDPALNLIKGRGGALLHEKLVAVSARRLIIIASSEKLVERLGTRLPLPVEVVPFGWQHTARRVGDLGLDPVLRMAAGDAPFTTDGGHHILDCTGGPFDNPATLANALKQVTGVVDHGLFVGMADLALTIDAAGRIQEHATQSRD